MLLVRLVDQDHRLGAENPDVKLMKEREIPWNELAFPTIRETMRRYFMDRKQGTFRFHVEDIEPG